MVPASTGGAAQGGPEVVVGVFCLDRAGEPLFGASSRLWALLGQVLGALRAERVTRAWTVDGYVPSWLARSWGDLLFADLGEVVLVCRPLPGRGPELTPIGTYRRGAALAPAWSRSGEHLGVYDTPVAPVLLRLAQTCTVSGGFSITTLRPPAPGSPRSEVAARRLLQRSGMLAPLPRAPRRTPLPPSPRSH